MAVFIERLTGLDRPSFSRWLVGGTDLGIPYYIENYNSVAFLFGDTFNTNFPNGSNVPNGPVYLPNDWRAPVALRSGVHPSNVIAFDSAFQVAGDGRAPEILPNGHNGDAGYGWEVSVIPNDGFSTPDNRHFVSYMSIANWNVVGPLGPQWKSAYAGLAVSYDGNNFTRTDYRNWNNNDNTDPFQMWSFQREGDWVYFVSVRSGRQYGPMMLRRCLWWDILDGRAHQLWGYYNGAWTWSSPFCTPILNGIFGEPSFRKLASGVWVLSYLNGLTGCLVTRTAPRPDAPWSGEKIQVGPGYYGGFIHPWSDVGGNNLHLMVSEWNASNYFMSQWRGTL